jgi:hypothetical protein
VRQLPTFRQEAAGCPLVLYGTPVNPRHGSAKNPPLKDGEGDSTDFRILGVVKCNVLLDDRPFIELPRYIPAGDPKDPPKFLIFCEVFQGKPDPFKGVIVKSDAALKYLRGALALDAADRLAALRYFVRFLGDEDPEVAKDACLELLKADYKDLRRLAEKLPADTLAGLLQDPQLAPRNRSLCALLLGHCGTDKHAKLLRRLLGPPQGSLQECNSREEMLTGYVLLKPKEGWSYLRGVLKDDREDFPVRYAGLRTIRFLWDTRPDLVDKKELVEGVCLLLPQSDIADLAINDLRRWGRWEALERVLALSESKAHNLPVVRRSILRFALSCQHLPRAAAFVKKMRQQDPEWVSEAEELLKLETEPPGGRPRKVG